MSGIWCPILAEDRWTLRLCSLHIRGGGPLLSIPLLLQQALCKVYTALMKKKQIRLSKAGWSGSVNLDFLYLGVVLGVHYIVSDYLGTGVDYIVSDYLGTGCPLYCVWLPRYWLLGCFDGRLGLGSLNLINTIVKDKPLPNDCSQ